MFDYRDARQQVEDYLGDFLDDYDIDGIIDEMRDLDTDDVDAIDTDDWTDFVERHDTSDK